MPDSSGILYPLETGARVNVKEQKERTKFNRQQAAALARFNCWTCPRFERCGKTSCPLEKSDSEPAPQMRVNQPRETPEDKKAARREYQKKYYQENREEIIKKKREYQEQNREIYLAKKRAWSKKNYIKKQKEKEAKAPL